MYRDVVAEADRVVLLLAIAVDPADRTLPVDDHVVAVADVEEIGVAVAATDQRVVAAASVDRLGEIRARQRLACGRPDQVDVLRVEVPVTDDTVGENEGLNRILLPAGAVILLLKDDLVTRAAQLQDKRRAGASKFDVVEIDAFENQPIALALAVKDRVRAVAASEDIGVRAAHAFEAIVAGAAVMGIGDVEAVDGVVAIRARQVNDVLGELDVVPDGSVGKFQSFDHVAEAEQHLGEILVFEDHRVVRALHTHGDRGRSAVALEFEVGPAQAVDELQRVVAAAEKVIRAVFHHVAAVAAAIDVSVVLRPADEHVVALAAIQFVVVVEAVDDVGAVGLQVDQHPRHEVGIAQE
ncbi:hypothetical protein FQZ97_847020 [compost metagenome]